MGTGHRETVTSFQCASLLEPGVAEETMKRRYRKQSKGNGLYFHNLMFGFHKFYHKRFKPSFLKSLGYTLESDTVSLIFDEQKAISYLQTTTGASSIIVDKVEEGIISPNSKADYLLYKAKVDNPNYTFNLEDKSIIVPSGIDNSSRVYKLIRKDFLSYSSIQFWFMKPVDTTVKDYLASNYGYNSKYFQYSDNYFYEPDMGSITYSSGTLSVTCNGVSTDIITKVVTTTVTVTVTSVDENGKSNTTSSQSVTTQETVTYSPTVEREEGLENSSVTTTSGNTTTTVDTTYEIQTVVPDPITLEIPPEYIKITSSDSTLEGPATLIEYYTSPGQSSNNKMYHVSAYNANPFHKTGGYWVTPAIPLKADGEFVKETPQLKRVLKKLALNFGDLKDGLGDVSIKMADIVIAVDPLNEEAYTNAKILYQLFSSLKGSGSYSYSGQGMTASYYYGLKETTVQGTFDFNTLPKELEVNNTVCEDVSSEDAYSFSVCHNERYFYDTVALTAYKQGVHKKAPTTGIVEPNTYILAVTLKSTGVEKEDDEGYTTYEYHTEYEIILVYQKEGYYHEIRVMDPHILYSVYGYDAEVGVGTDPKSYQVRNLTRPDNDAFRFYPPLSLVNAMPYKEWVVMYENALSLYAFSKKSVFVDWYQESWFGAVLQIAGIFLMLVPGGQGIGSLLISIAVGLTVVLILNWAAAQFGGDVAKILAVVVTIVGIYYGIPGYTADSASTWLSLADQEIGIHQEMEKHRLEALVAETEEIKKKTEELQEKLDDIDKRYPIETVYPGWDISGIPNPIFQAIESYVNSVINTGTLMDNETLYSIESHIEARNKVYVGW